MDLIKKGQIFGPTQCDMYTIEWPKRGLPHAHILLWLSTKIKSTDIDKIISAELPDPALDMVLYDIVKANMVHGPCGRGFNLNSPCLKDGVCSKKLPRKFLQATQTGADGYPSYRRRKPQNGGFTANIAQHEVDNRWIVPYCPLLSKIFNAHINVESCNSVKSIKYVCKYLNKGSDAAMFGLQQQYCQNEVTYYQVGRYISSNEAFSRIFGFPLHQRHPAIQQLAVHIENGQRVYFTDVNASLLAEQPRDSTLTAFLKLCQLDPFAQTLLYPQIPSYYTWNGKKWRPRKAGQNVCGYPGIKFDTCLGRVYTVHPTQQECFYLRLLLHEVRGPTSFQALKAVHGHVCTAYREACYRQGLLEDGAQWDATLGEAALSESPKSLRALFAVLLQTCELCDPANLWLKYRDGLAEDFHRQAQRLCPDMEGISNEVYNKTLIDIEDRIATLGGNELSTYGLPQTFRSGSNSLPTAVIRETSYDTQALSNYIAENKHKLLPDQLQAYTTIINSVRQRDGRIFFLDAPGGTGKTFITKILLAEVRQHQDIAVAVDSSGIAATLLPGGRTVHSTFKLHLNLAASEMPSCSITKSSDQGQVLKRCYLNAWDECTMAHKRALEALDRALKDIRDCHAPMGGVTLLLSGDFRQTLPVIPKGTRADEVQACLKSSTLWHHVTILTVNTNMRAQLHGDKMSK
ncbi:uncharacterized protein LOC106867169 [Octopus bimaculoides]|uniref:uncharacterized protein LOC106867169 n=1 Tax=Octopus bimaculoides TaxID=37653 RepID=UPI00071C3CDC|nr:uncharacterized protein LOC106867169 [Octopus bimaculoides]|eukprot:XP_014767446.1 PREDICTED: uncharacterized protein LOC106867169 [Octopus bimaculoides]